jgi:hypothetical protein
MLRLRLLGPSSTKKPVSYLIVVMKINVAESADEMDEDFSAAIRQMEKLARSDASIEGRRSAAAGPR